jgi:hypothetical protein
MLNHYYFHIKDTFSDLWPSRYTSGKDKSASLSEKDIMNEHKIGLK